jgi:hypothetical protein
MGSLANAPGSHSNGVETGDSEERGDETGDHDKKRHKEKL